MVPYGGADGLPESMDRVKLIVTEKDKNMKYKKTIIAIVCVILLMAALIAVYPMLGKEAISKDIQRFLAEDGIAETDILEIDVRHNYISGILGYGQWHTSIFFADEPEVEYHCVLSDDLIPKVDAICAGGFPSDSPEIADII